MDFGIGRQQVFLLRAALCPDAAKAAAALDQWWANIADFDEVRGTDANLFPQIYWNLGPRISDPELRARLKGTARHHWVRNQYLVTTGGQLLDVLNRTRIPVLLLKGAAIASTIDDDVGLRTMSDCDMLVPKGRALEVMDLLAGANLLEPGNASERDLDVIHGVTLGLRKNRHAAFDIHWRPVRAIGAEALAEEMFAAARPITFAGQRCLVPCPEHLVFHAIIHGIDWSPHPRYDWLVDTIKILRRTDSTFDWDKLADVALRYRFGSAIGAALKEARDRAGVAVPGAVLRRLRRPWALLERLEGRARLSKPSSRSVTQEILLALQTIRRQDEDRLNRLAWRATPSLIQSVFGPVSASRAFIHNDRKERITFLQGWSAPEPNGRWTDGRVVSCAIYAPSGTRPTSLTLRGRPFAHQATAPHVVEVFAGWRRLGTMRWRKSGQRPFVQQVRLPPTIWRGETAVIRFNVRKPVCPIETGYNGDTRALGIFVERLSVDPVTRDVTREPLDLSSGGSDLDVLWHGWCPPETDGCWIDRKIAVLRWRIAQDIPRGSHLHVDIGHVADHHDAVQGQIVINEKPLGAFRCASAAHNQRVSVPLPGEILAGQDLTITFRLQAPRARRSGKGSDRHRILSIRHVSIGTPGAHS